jgi:hypothetical protein
MNRENFPGLQFWALFASELPNRDDFLDPRVDELDMAHSEWMNRLRHQLRIAYPYGGQSTQFDMRLLEAHRLVTTESLSDAGKNDYVVRVMNGRGQMELVLWLSALVCFRVN